MIFNRVHIGGRTVMVEDRGSDHEDVQLEMKEVAKARQDDQKYYFPALGIGFLMHATIFGAIAYLTMQLTTAEYRGAALAVMSAAYVASFVSVHSSMIHGRIRRMEVHALTVHEELLRVGDKVTTAQQ